jgi:hypothetical protein
MTALPLCTLPVRLTVPPSVRKHAYVKEAAITARAMLGSKNSTNGGVIGTEDNRRCELYAWLNPVRPHIDDPVGKWMYAAVLVRSRCSGVWCLDRDNSKTGSKHYKSFGFVGSVFRLNDSVAHWTEGNGITVAAFVGGFSEPADVEALTILQRGINRLASGARTAPRIRNGFRRPLPGEVWATNDFENVHAVRRSLAERRGWHIENCAVCGESAWEMDSHWPYHVDRNRCLSCLSADNKEAGAA